MSKKVRYEKESGLHAEFKRLLLSLPLQPIIGADYSIMWPSDDTSVWRSELVCVQWFYEAGGTQYVSLSSDWGDGGMELKKWYAKAQRREIVECVEHGRRR